MNGSSPVLYVYHHEEDGIWEFGGAEDSNDDDYVVISFEEIINIDPSVLTIISLELGYYASRKSQKEGWVINKIP